MANGRKLDAWDGDVGAIPEAMDAAFATSQAKHKGERREHGRNVGENALWALMALILPAVLPGGAAYGAAGGLGRQMGLPGGAAALEKLRGLGPVPKYNPQGPGMPGPTGFQLARGQRPPTGAGMAADRLRPRPGPGTAPMGRLDPLRGPPHASRGGAGGRRPPGEALDEDFFGVGRAGAASESATLGRLPGGMGWRHAAARGRGAPDMGAPTGMGHAAEQGAAFARTRSAAGRRNVSGVSQTPGPADQLRAMLRGPRGGQTGFMNELINEFRALNSLPRQLTMQESARLQQLSQQIQTLGAQGGGAMNMGQYFKQVSPGGIQGSGGW